MIFFVIISDFNILPLKVNDCYIYVMYCRHILILSLLIVFSGLSDAKAQVTMPSNRFTTHDGIPQIQVVDMMQDSKGYLWVGTKRGVARYNGTNWKSFPETEKFEIYSIIENSQGDIILLPKLSGIAHFYKIVGESLVKSDGQLYDLTSANTTFKNDTLFHQNILESKLQYFDLVSMKLIGEKEFDITKYRMTNYSNKHGLILIEKKGPQRYEYIRERDKKILWTRQLAKNFINVRKVGDRILDNQVEGFIELYSNNTFEKIAEVKTEGKKLIDVKVFMPEEFYYCDGKFNYQINPSTGDLEKLNLINTTRNIFLRDLDGNLWNSSEAGIQFFPKTRFVNYDVNALNDAWFFQPYKDHYVYGNFSGGLKKVELNPLVIEPIASNKRNSIYFDPSMVGNKLYIPGSSYISIYEDGKVDYVDIQSANTPLLCSYFDQSNGKVFFGGLKSLVELGQDNSFIIHKDLEDVFSRYILAIEEYGDDHLILGSSSDLVSFNKNTKKFSSLNYLFDSDEIFGAVSITKDDKGNLWIGNKKGLWFLNVNTNKLLQIGEEVIDGYIVSLAQINCNLLAVGTSKELMLLELSLFYNNNEIQIKTYNHKNGFKGEEIGQNGFSVQDSIMWIPTATKLISTKINNLEFDKPFSNLEISSINGRHLDNSNLIDGVYNMTYGVSDLEIKFNAVGFNLPSVSKFQYKLKGNDSDWSDWRAESKAIYRNLNAGEYTFKVRAKNGSMFGSDYPEKEVRLKLDMAFYKEPNFYKNALLFSFILLGLIGLLLFIIYTRIKEKRELDKQFKLLQVQTLQLQLNPHFLFNVLGSIQSLILVKDYENANKYLVSFSKMIRRYLDYNVSAYKSLQSNSRDAINISLKEELEIIKIYLDFEKLQLEEKFSYTILIDDSVDTNEITIPPLIIQPLLENAIKHGVIPKKGNAMIEIKIIKFESGVRITILDDGIGIARSAELQRKTKKEFKSQGLELVNQRINVLNTMGENISLEIKDNGGKGVEQIIFFKETEN